MKFFINQARQGDVLLTRIDCLPEGLKLEQPVDGHFVVAHSESGHSHVVSADYVEMYVDEVNPFIGYLTVEDATFIEHLKTSFDAHETIQLEPGIYRINRQREYTSEGFRRAMD